jgi:maltose O-acetyltransferase
MNRIWSHIRNDLQVLHFRLYLAQLLAAPLPPFFGSGLRARLLALAGFSIGTGTVFWGMPAFSGAGNIYARLKIGEQCWLSVGCFIDLAGNITLEDRVTFGPEVMILTGSHSIHDQHRRSGELRVNPVTIGRGAWLGARCTVLPGVSIGQGAVIGAGALVNKDIPPNTMAAGVPAVVIREL